MTLIRCAESLQNAIANGDGQSLALVTEPVGVRDADVSVHRSWVGAVMSG